MKVCELIELLEETDPNADILLRTQLSWPCEDTVIGIRIRENVRELRVEIAEPDGHHVWVTDHSGSVASLPDLIEERLDQCGQAMGVSDWRDHLLVDRE